MTKRVCELEVGDVFILWSAPVKAMKIEEGRIYYKYESDVFGASGRQSLGARSQQKVEVVELKKAA